MRPAKREVLISQKFGHSLYFPPALLEPIKSCELLEQSKQSKTKIATLWDNKDEDHETQPPTNNPLAYFAGGSEHSGQQILAPDQASSNALPVRLWRNGFTVGDDGELRDYNTPDNKKFLECLKRGETPTELLDRMKDGFIDVKLENKGTEDFKPPTKVQPFSGKGHRLGSPSPQV